MKKELKIIWTLIGAIFAIITIINNYLTKQGFTEEVVLINSHLIVVLLFLGIVLSVLIFILDIGDNS